MVHVLHDGAIAIEMKGLKKVLKAIPGKHSLELIQQTAIQNMESTAA